jgi:formate hydrogenlyase subunit 3/multisubunit Na+/H+ antiporter MnhD subunit
VTTSALLLLAAAWPVALLACSVIPPFRPAVARLLPTLALPALALAFSGESALELSAPGVFTSMRLGVDATGQPFLLLTALLWTVCGFHAVAYMREDPRRLGFAGLMTATGTGNIGLVIAQDTLSFYLFFALMTFAGYGLVIHARTTAALRAGRVYITMAILGEALILAGLFHLIGFAGDASFQQVPAAYAAMPAPAVAAVLLLAGFGVKAGLLPLHLWLPLAHPVAPTPASALLSGAMIKAGLLGWLRFLPVGTMALPSLGAALMLLGVAATLLAAIAGVTQREIKTVLAYSSISQMGFMTVGVGAALALPQPAPLLLLAVAVYAVHHAIAKAALFLGVSAVAGTRPRWRLLAAALPGLVLAGAPLSSGAMAKAALKQGLGEVPNPGPIALDLLLTLAAIGTTLLMARYLALLAVRTDRTPAHAGPGLTLPWLVLVAASGLAALWLPWMLAPLGELPLATGAGYAAAALWPIALGVLLAGSAILLGRRYPALSTAAVPAGDLVALVERGLAAARRTALPMARLELADAVRNRWVVVRRRSGELVDRAAAGYEAVATGPVLGALFVLVALLLFAALR